MFTKHCRLMAFLLCCLTLFCSAAIAAVPNCVSFQGKLTNSSGTPISDGAYDIVFKFYDAATGGNLLLTDRHLGASGGAVQVTGGLYSTLLGGGTIVAGAESTLWNVFLNHNEVYLGVTVGTDSEMTPRILLTWAPYAVNAENAAKLGGLPPSSYLDVSANTQSKSGKLSVSGSSSGSAILEAVNAGTTPNSSGLNASAAGAGVPGINATSTSSTGIGVKSTVTSSDASIVAVNKGSGPVIKGMSGALGTTVVFQVSANGDTTVFGTGKVTASSYSFPTTQPKTGRLVISPADVVAIANDDIALNEYRMWGWHYGGTKENISYLQAAQAYTWAGFWAPIHLPDGAKITNILMGINDTDPLTQSEWRLSKFSIVGGTTGQHIVTGYSVDNLPVTETEVNNYIVDNNGYYLVLGLKLQAAQSGAVTFTGAMIEYTYTDLKN